MFSQVGKVEKLVGWESDGDNSRDSESQELRVEVDTSNKEEEKVCIGDRDES